MDIVATKVDIIGLTVKLNREDLDNLCKLATLLRMTTKQNAYDVVKGLADDLQKFIDYIIDDLPNKKGKYEDSHEEDGGNNESSEGQDMFCPEQTREKAASGLVKVSVNNIDDNCVLHAAISILGEFVSNNTIPVEAYIKQNKGVYVTEEQLEKLLDKLLAYNIKHPNKPLSVTIGGLHMDQDERKFLWFMIASLSIMVMVLTKGQSDLEDRVKQDHESIVDMSFKMDTADEDTLVYYDIKTHHYEIAK